MLLRWFRFSRSVCLCWHQRGHQPKHVSIGWKVAQRSIDLTFWLNLVIHAHYLSSKWNVFCARSEREKKTPITMATTTARPKTPLVKHSQFFVSHCQCLSLLITFFGPPFFFTLHCILAMFGHVYILCFAFTCRLYKSFAAHVKSIFRLRVGVFSLLFTAKSSASSTSIFDVVVFSNRN